MLTSPKLLLATLVACVFGTTATAQQLLSDPGFETGTLDVWTVVTGSNPANVTVESTLPQSGTYHFQHQDALNSGVNNDFGNSSISQTVDISSYQGQAFEASIWSLWTSGSSVDLVLSVEFDSGDIFSETFSTLGGGVYTENALSSVGALIPDTATTATYTVLLDKTGAGKPVVYLDDASFLLGDHTVAGDADGDGVVDFDDFLHLKDYLFTDVTPGEHGDFNYTGQPDFEDFGEWKSISTELGMYQRLGIRNDEEPIMEAGS